MNAAAELLRNIGEIASKLIGRSSFCLELRNKLTNKLITGDLSRLNHSIEFFGRDTKGSCCYLQGSRKLLRQLTTQFFRLNLSL